MRLHEVTRHAQRDRPALGALKQRCDVAVGHLAAAARHQFPSLAETQSRFGQADFRQQAAADHQVQARRVRPRHPRVRG
jgi:hypothetical protein